MTSYKLYPDFHQLSEDDCGALMQNNMFGYLCESLNLGLIAGSNEDRQLLANEQFFNLLGLEPTSKNAELTELFANLDLVCKVELLKKYLELKDKRTRKFVCDFRYKVDNRNKVIRLVMTRNPMGGEKAEDWLYGFTYDLTPSIDRFRSQFLSEVTHDLRVPLGAILECTRALQDPRENLKKDKYLNILECSAKHLKSLSESYLGYTSAENSDYEIKPIDFDVWHLFNAVLEINSMGLNNDKVIAMTTPFEKRVVHSDPFRIEQLLNNLISNSKKYTEKGVIAFGYTIDDEKLNIFVSDTGIGISDEFKPMLFQPFTQKDPNKPGVGLGLSICKHIVDRMKGKIEVYSRLHFGTRFFISLPLAEQD